MHPANHAIQFPDRPAVIMVSTGRSTSYAKLDRQSNRAAHAFRQLGLARGDVVAIVLDNCAEIFSIAWGAQRAGLYLTSISTKLSQADVRYIVRDCDAKVLIASDSMADLASLAVSETHVKGFLLDGSQPGFSSWRDYVVSQPDTRIADESPGNDMLYSSGTTGRPKGVRPPLPDGGIDAPNAMSRMGATYYDMGEDSVYLSTSPLYHAAPLRWAMTIQRLGGTVVVMERFDAESALRLIEMHGITHSTWVPTHFARLLKLPDDVRSAYDLSSHRVAIHAAAPCPIPIKQQMIDWWGPIIYEYYSATEMCGMTALTSEEWLARPGSVGRAILGKVRITDENGEEMPVGATGNVFFSDGPAFEYHKDPEKTASVRNRHGWATMGDVGHIDEVGYLYLTDRKSFMIISGGVNIYPQEIENCLATHPKVADVAVFGVPDDEMGERVMAVVEPTEWRDAGDDLTEELQAYTRQALGGLKCPRQFDFRQTLPREPTGKLMKRLLRDEYCGALTR